MSATTVLAEADDGARVVVGLVDAADEAELIRRWPPRGLTRLAADAAGATGMADAKDAEPPARRFRVEAGPDTAGWDRVESDLGLFAAEHLADLVAVHAALAIVDGRALVLPGRSFAGKTTLALALARAGAVVASDEYTLVDPATGLVRGWPRPARVRLPEGGSRREPVAADAPTVPVGLVALLRHAADVAAPLDVRHPSRADAVVAVLDETVCARSRPDAALDAALAITSGAVVQGRRGEADAAAAALVATMRGASA